MAGSRHSLRQLSLQLEAFSVVFSPQPWMLIGINCLINNFLINTRTRHPNGHFVTFPIRNYGCLKVKATSARRVLSCVRLFSPVQDIANTLRVNEMQCECHPAGLHPAKPSAPWKTTRFRYGNQWETTIIGQHEIAVKTSFKRNDRGNPCMQMCGNAFKTCCTASCGRTRRRTAYAKCLPMPVYLRNILSSSITAAVDAASAASCRPAPRGSGHEEPHRARLAPV